MDHSSFSDDEEDDSPPTPLINNNNNSDESCSSSSPTFPCLSSSSVRIDDDEWLTTAVDEYSYARIRDTLQDRWITFANGLVPWRDDKVFVFGPEGETGERSKIFLMVDVGKGCGKMLLNHLVFNMFKKLEWNSVVVLHLVQIGIECLHPSLPSQFGFL